MDRFLEKFRQFRRELKRRKVYKVAGVYAAVAFIIVQVANLTFPALHIPPWAYSLVVVLAIMGFPLALVLAWALELTPEGVRRVRSRTPSWEVADAEPDQGPRRTPRKVIVSLVLLVIAIGGGWYLIQDGNKVTAAERSVAVLPFEVSGAGAEAWRDGMVTMLSTGLDGAAGLRAIADRTVFATWDQVQQVQSGASTKEALNVARELGARYAIVGSAVALGEELRFTADVREVNSGKRLDLVAVRGSPDSVTALADDLTRQILAVLLQQQDNTIPAVDLGRLTTNSLPALKAFLDGERHYRAGKYQAAIEDYRVAIRQDSSFALAWRRLAASTGWIEGWEPDAHQWERAYALAHRLPRRERRLVRAWHLKYHQNRSVAAADSLRQLTEDYPDDPWMWYRLGEVLHHSRIPRGLPETEQTFQRAVVLEPGVAPYHHHLIELAFFFRRDSSLAAKRIAAQPEGIFKQRGKWILDLVFGSKSQRRQALAVLDTLPAISEMRPFDNAVVTLLHPTDQAFQERVIRKLRDRVDIGNQQYTGVLLLNLLGRGQIRDAVPMLTSDVENVVASPPLLLPGLLGLNYPLPDSVQRHYLALKELPGNPTIRQLLGSGIFLIEQERKADLSMLFSRIRQAASREYEQDSVAQIHVQRALSELHGYQAYHAGDWARAIEYWHDQNLFWDFGAIWRGECYRKLGRFKKAEGWYLSAWRFPVVHEKLGRLYEEMGKPNAAIAAYRRFLTAWDEADPVLQNRVIRVRERVEALKPEVAHGQ